MKLNIKATNRANNQLWRRRNRISLETYQEGSAVPCEIFSRLMDRLTCMHLNPERILNISINPLWSALLLKKQFPNAKMVSLDLSLPLLMQGRGVAGDMCCGHADAIPFQNQSMDLVVVHLSLSHYQNPVSLLHEIRRVMRDEGVLFFSHYGLDTLKRFQEENKGQSCPLMINSFLDMHHIGDELLQSAFQFPVVDMEHLEVSYATWWEMLKDLRFMGGCMDQAGSRVSKQAYQAWLSQGRKSAMLDLELIYGHAVASPNRGLMMEDGGVAIPLDALKRK